MLPLSVPHFTAQLRQELRTLATLAVLLSLSLLALQCVAPLPVRRHRDSTNMKLAVLLISLLFLATTPMIEAKKKPKPGCTKKCDTSVVQPEGDGSVGTLPCKCEKACSQKEGSKKQCKKCTQKFNKKCLKKECTKKCKNKTKKAKKKCVKQCMAGKGKDE